MPSPGRTLAVGSLPVGSLLGSLDRGELGAAVVGALVAEDVDGEDEPGSLSVWGPASVAEHADSTTIIAMAGVVLGNGSLLGHLSDAGSTTMVALSSAYGGSLPERVVGCSLEWLRSVGGSDLPAP